MKVFASIVILAASTFVQAQDKDFNFGLHAHGSTTPAAIGLPAFPGAVPFKDKTDDSDSADLGFTLNSFHVGLRFAQLQTTQPRDAVTSFYRKALAKYGDVLECRNGVAVGPRKVASSGLTCKDGDDSSGDKKNDGSKSSGGSMSINGQSDRGGVQLRAGFPHSFHLVEIDDKPTAGATRFLIMSLDLPRSGTD